MPYCDIKTTVKIQKKQKMELSHAVAKVIELIPGKSERWVMCSIQSEAAIAFAGIDDQLSAMITLKTFGELEKEQYDLLTEQLCRKINNILGVPEDRIYVIYEPVLHWGWNGNNF